MSERTNIETSGVVVLVFDSGAEWRCFDQSRAKRLPVDSGMRITRGMYPRLEGEDDESLIKRLDAPPDAKVIRFTTAQPDEQPMKWPGVEGEARVESLGSGAAWQVVQGKVPGGYHARYVCASTRAAAITESETT